MPTPVHGYENPSFFYEGMEVWIDCRLAGIKDRPPGCGLRCLVVAPHGDTARVVNEKYGFDRLMSKWDCYIKHVDNQS